MGMRAIVSNKKLSVNQLEKMITRRKVKRTKIEKKRESKGGTETKRLNKRRKQKKKGRTTHLLRPDLLHCCLISANLWTLVPA